MKIFRASPLKPSYMELTAAEDAPDNVGLSIYPGAEWLWGGSQLSQLCCSKMDSIPYQNWAITDILHIF